MKLSVTGYKSISEKQTISFDGLTVMAGANSSGKSSFIQPFLILKQTIENHYDSGVLELFGENVKLTDASQVISKVKGYSNKSFSLEMIHKDTTCIVNYRYKRQHGLIIDEVNFITPDMPDGLNLRAKMASKDIERNVSEEEFKFIKRFYNDEKLTSKWSVIQDKCFLKAELSFTGKEFSPLRAGIDPSANIEQFVKRLIHVPGLRGNPERKYKIANTENIYPGSFEKYVASIISNWINSKQHKEKHTLLINQLVELGLASNITANKIDDTSVELQISRLKSSSCSDCVNIADVGFGVSQTLPVLVALICAKKNQFVFIEQPELHLHPNAQFKLVESISDAINRGVKVIIETHSSIILRGIQISVVKNKIEKDKVSLNWFTQDKDSGKTIVTKAKLDSFGAFGDWPENFDDTYLKVEQLYLDAVEEKSFE